MSPTGISYTIQESNRSRRLTIRLDSEGQIVVTVPPRFPKYRIAEFVESAKDWIERQRKTQSQKPKLISATHVLYFGKEYNVKISNRFDGTVKLGKTVIIVAPLVSSQVSSAKQYSSTQMAELKKATVALLSSWLKSRATEYLAKRVYELSEQMGLPFNGLAFKQQKTRWGSCSSTKHLNFNWKLIHAPSEVIDYVIIHELAHTRHMNHGKHFWDLVAQYDPDHPHHRRWLSRYGSTED